jgi:tetratricopeptide (TPR) repeat protein
LSIPLLGCALTLSARAAWIELRHGPFVVYSDAGAEAARVSLNELEQLRYAVGEAAGKPEATLAWPVEAVVRKRGVEGKESAAGAPVFGFSRAGFVIYLRAGEQPPEALLRALALAILEHNVPRPMAAGFEHAIASLYATMRVQGARWTVGAPPVAEERTEEWALIHRLIVVDESRSRAHVFLSNLANGAEEEIAWRNVYGSRQSGRWTPEQRALAAEYLKAGSFATRVLPARLVPQAEMHEAPALAGRIRLLPGDLALARHEAPAKVRAAYEAALNEKASPAGHEGRGLAYLLEGRTEDARAELAAAAAGEGAGPRAYYELAKLEPDKARKEKLLEQAVKLNMQWAEPFMELAHLEAGPVRRAFHLKKAAELRPRDAELWQELARAQFEAGQLDAAEKSMRVALEDTPGQSRRCRRATKPSNRSARTKKPRNASASATRSRPRSSACGRPSWSASARPNARPTRRRAPRAARRRSNGATPRRRSA